MSHRHAHTHKHTYIDKHTPALLVLHTPALQVLLVLAIITSTDYEYKVSSISTEKENSEKLHPAMPTMVKVST